MNAHVRLFLFTLGLPLLATILAWACIAKVDGDLRDQVRKRFPATTEEQLRHLTVSWVASQGGYTATAELPEIYAHLKLARATAIATGVFGLALIGAIYLAGHATRTRRDLLLRLFRSGLFVTLSLVGVLTAAQAIAAAYAFYYFESIFIEQVHYILIIGVAIGGVLALLAVLRAMFSLKYSSVFNVFGESVAPEAQPALWNTVREICQELKAAPPDNIVLGLEPSFYVTESELITAGGRLKGRTLFLSLSLSRLLTVAELRAIIGHEMAHFIGDDTVFSQRFFPVYRGTLVALANLSRNAVHGSVAIAQLPAVMFLQFFYQSFDASEKNLSRKRETEADAVGARVGGGANLATALVKVHACFDGWKKVVDGAKFNVEELRAQPNLAVPFYEHAARLKPDALMKAGGNHIFHPTDSHPALTLRLQSLQTNLAAAVSDTSVPAFESSAAALIVGVIELEVKQSAALRKLVRPTTS